MVIYLIMTVTASLLLRLLERRLAGDAAYDLATTDTLAHTSGMIHIPDKKKEGGKR